ncbi:Hypothetical protein CINCED_3A010572 [Cinara cedri]|uniref:Double jelly roll-like domain-containing protein n=1 Tax=Cinara cedri TaxID=506608 RepID=A0A5E4NNN8_9HEMI|nr:Hypothetical protein CINCED_3A010572 [Cinara cedri]
MGIQFYNINRTAKSDKNSRIKTTTKSTLWVKTDEKNNSKHRKHKKRLTAKNLAFLRSIVNPGIATILKEYCSYTKSGIASRQNAAWDSDFKNANTNFIETDSFNGCINLRDLFGFCEDYKRILINCNQQLVLNRASSDMNAIKFTKPDTPKLSEIKVNIKKILWRMPMVRVSDKEKIRLMKNTAHSWKVKTTNKLEKLRFVIIGFQTDKKNSETKPMSCFDNCPVKNLKVYLNSETFPYEDFQSDFTKNKIATVYRAYAEFQKSYYGRDIVTPLLTRSEFKTYAPIIVIDMSRQNDNLKTSTVDLRIEFEAEIAFPPSTSAYCLILHDQIITYNPFNGESLCTTVSSRISETHTERRCRCVFERPALDNPFISERIFYRRTLMKYFYCYAIRVHKENRHPANVSKTIISSSSSSSSSALPYSRAGTARDTNTVERASERARVKGRGRVFENTLLRGGGRSI